MGKIDISLIALDSIYGLKVHETEIIPISDYKLQSSANGETELCVTIRGISSALELAASLDYKPIE